MDKHTPGVSFDEVRNNYLCQVKSKSGKKTLGRFATEAEAVIAHADYVWRNGDQWKPTGLKPGPKGPGIAQIIRVNGNAKGTGTRERVQALSDALNDLGDMLTPLVISVADLRIPMELDLQFYKANGMSLSVYTECLRKTSTAVGLLLEEVERGWGGEMKRRRPKPVSRSSRKPAAKHRFNNRYSGARTPTDFINQTGKNK